MIPVVKAKGFSFRAGTFRLDKITFEVLSKETVAILGATGSGKTLLLESIAGIHKPDSGAMEVAGLCISQVPIENRGIGFVYQDCCLFPHMTVYNNIAYGLKIRKIPPTLIKEQVNTIAESFFISHILNQYPNTLSGGEKQRTSLARALVLRPDLMLLDEPFSALDPVTKQTLYQLLNRVRTDYGCAIVFVTHDFNEAQLLADRVGIMVEGQMKAFRRSDELLSPYADEQINKFLGLEVLH